VLTLEIQTEQIAEAICKMDRNELQKLLCIISAQVEPVSFSTTISYYQEDQGYLARCFPIDAVAWGDTSEESLESLIDAILEISETLIENCPNPDEFMQKKLYCAQIIYKHRESRDEVKSILGFYTNKQIYMDYS
jgi:hypothetical protein